MKKKKDKGNVLIACLVILIFVIIILAFNKTNWTGKETSRDIVSRDQITEYGNYIQVEYECISIAKVQGSGSMEQTFGGGHNLITTSCFKQEELSKGDIIGYKFLGDLFVHRIIEVGEDNHGWYVITQGDNCNYQDEKVRFSDIEVLVLGVVY